MVAHRYEFAKKESKCKVTTVDEKPAPAGWKCRCFERKGFQSITFTGPGFGGNWVRGATGSCPLTQPTSFEVVNPADGESFCVQAKCG